MAGRKPLPTPVKLMKATARPQRLNKDESKAPVAVPEAPVHLDGRARTKFAEMAEMLARYGVMTELDSGALARYAVIWCRWVDAEDALKRVGPTGVGDDVVGALRRLQEVHAALAKAPIIKIRAAHWARGLFQNPGHRAITAGTFPDVALELFVVDERMGRPSRRRKEVWAAQISKPLDRRLEATVDVVRRIHAGQYGTNGGSLQSERFDHCGMNASNLSVAQECRNLFLLIMSE